jgi:uncharacterized protein with GYD domain
MPPKAEQAEGGQSRIRGYFGYQEQLIQRRHTMATFIHLISFTDQGIRNVKDSPDRFEAYKAMAEKLGGKVKGVYYTMGHYDMLVILEAADELAMTAILKVGSLGNVRTETLRGFSLEEMKKIIAKMP